MMEMLARPLTVVAHDAGAANHIFAWLGVEQATLCLAGPARDLWEVRIHKTGFIPSQTLLSVSDLASALDSTATLITGTGWESSLEYDALKLAREHGIFSIAVIDHWSNYEARFVRNRQQVLPDEIWVSDPYAAEIAQKTFPSVKVIEQTNAYLEGLVAEVESCQAPSAALGNDRVLYVLEPIRYVWGDLADLGEFLALEYFMLHHNKANVSGDAEIRLRPHPSDPPGKYDAWLARQVNPRVSLDRSASLADALAWSNIVAGCQTYAMVLALACGRTVICTIPPWAPDLILPQLDFVRLSSLS